jgi:hypothetical protein
MKIPDPFNLLCAALVFAGIGLICLAISITGVKKEIEDIKKDIANCHCQVRK